MKIGVRSIYLTFLFKASVFFIICNTFLPASINDYWQQYVHYTMSITLIPESHEMKGTSHIVYINNSPENLDRIYMHLYPNAFQEGSVKYREFQQKYGRLGRIGPMLKDIAPYEAGITIHGFKITMGGDHFSELIKIEDTILEAVLPRYLAPDDSLIIDIEWTHHVGEQIERAGYVDDQYNAAQWYPKMVVFDEKGWHNDPFHAGGEFYGEFSTFDVTLDLPEKYIIGGTGVVTSGDPGWKNVEVDTSINFKEWLKSYQENKIQPDSSVRRVVTFHAERVHDFAWIASPTFLYEYGNWNGIDVHVLYNESNGKSWTKVVRERSERALEWLSTNFGMYPYPQVTTTDRIKGGGMEYPMLVMNGRDSEGLIVHEIGHIWFYGILANNELDEAWIDEGFTTFQTWWYLHNRYPPTGLDFSLPKYKPFQKKLWKYRRQLDGSQWSAIKFSASGFDEPISRSSYLFGSGSSYRYNAYTKPALMLYELKYILGDSVFLSGMKSYYSHWNLKHVNEDRFISTIEKVSGQKLDWFFNAWLHDTQKLDFALEKWKKKKMLDGSWEVTLELLQKGDRFLPIEIETKLKGGSAHRTWYKNHLWRFSDTFVYSVPEEPCRVILDPDGYTVDFDRRNNQSGWMNHELFFRWPGMNYEPRNSYVIKWSPLLYYHELDGIIPGAYITRKYGPWEKTDVTFNYAPDSRKIYWSLRHWIKPVHFLPGISWDVLAYSQGGLNGQGIRLHGNWTQKYSVPPFHKWTLGFYRTNATDTSRTNLFEIGTVHAYFGKYKIHFHSHSIELETTVAPNGLSDWSFQRITGTMNLSKNFGKFGIRNRVNIGKIWAGEDGVPSQERYTIEGAGSGDVFTNPFLRDESSFYGNINLRNHYHLSGDGNLRGYVNKGYAGSEKLIANSLECFYKKTIIGLNIELAGFIDAGVFWGSKWEQGDEMFDGTTLADAGIGIRMEKNWFGKDFYIRLDSPFWLNTIYGNENSVDYSRWIFSFSSGI